MASSLHKRLRRCSSMAFAVQPALPSVNSKSNGTFADNPHSAYRIQKSKGLAAPAGLLPPPPPHSMSPPALPRPMVLTLSLSSSSRSSCAGSSIVVSLQPGGALKSGNSRDSHACLTKQAQKMKNDVHNDFHQSRLWL